MSRIVTALVALAIIVVASLAARHPAGEPKIQATPMPTEVPVEVVGAVTTAEDVDVLAAPADGAEVVARLPAGILLPVTDASGGFVAVLTPCEDPGWVRLSGVQRHATADGEADRLEEATIVLDPGHGGQHPGAVGPTGLTEAEINLDIAWRVAEELGAARVFLTRSAQYTTGIAFRATVANQLGAHAFVSIHHNASPDRDSDVPGSETYHQQRSPGSKRLGGLIYEEVYGALSAYDIDWVTDNDAGAKARPRLDGEDLYGVLRMSNVPAVLAENLFISNAPEEQLLRRGDVAEAIAEAIARGIIRFIETSDPGSGFVEGQPIRGASSGALPTECQDPA